jgi:hypothetical protein
MAKGAIQSRKKRARKASKEEKQRKLKQPFWERAKNRFSVVSTTKKTNP